VRFLDDVFRFFTSASSWSGPDGILVRVGRQMELSVLAVAAAALVGVALGAVLGHTRRGSFVVVNSANAARAVPSLALLTVLAIQPFIARHRNGGFVAALVTMFALAVPPILTNAYVAIRGVDEDIRSAGKAMGMTNVQLFAKVELPLSVPLLLAGIRTAAVEVVATATLAAYVGFSDVGTYIFSGLSTQNVRGPFGGAAETFSGALLVAVLALGTDLFIAALARVVTPRGTRTDRRTRRYRGVASDAATVRPIAVR
jgi:osmoprotectant transport system permease protein